MRSNLIEVTLIKVTETDRAVGFKQDFKDEELVWLPKFDRDGDELIQLEPTKKAGIFEVTMPEYLAHEKELI